MFGRSGQMFPRQRAFHDAIYEEEYGSEQEDECCQSRGMSAVFCWFLSVIILIGLAASVVLTVFFILKSKGTISKNGELDVLYDGEHGINFHFPSTTESNTLDLQISASSSKESSKESSVHNNHSLEDEDETENNDFGTTSSKATTTSTRFPPSRRGPFEMSNEKSSEELNQPGITGSGDPPNQDDFPQSASRESFNSRHRSEEVLSEESSNRHSTSHRNDKSTEYDRATTLMTTTMSTIPSQHVLFTSSPDTPVTNATPYRRNLQTTRFPTGRTSFSTSTPSLHDDDESHATNEQHQPQDHDEDDDEDIPTPTQQEDSVTAPTVLYESKEREVDAKYEKEESQLKKMLLEEIPPHNDKESENTGFQRDHSKSREDSGISTLSSEFNLPTTTIPTPSSQTTSRDPLARIIKNLAPKWGRNRTIETTTMSSGSHKYDFTISSKEKDRSRLKESEENSSKDKYRSKESSTRTTVIITPETAIPTTKFKSSEFEVVKLGGRRGNNNQPINILNTVQSPNLSRRPPDQQPQNSDRESPFLDVLVGSEDHKTLITKQTEDGIVTSAILPPWYANTGGNVNNKTETSRNATERVDGNGNDLENEKTDDNDAGPKTVFGGFLDFFKRLPISNHNQQSNSKSIVLKRPAGELLAQGSSYVSQSSENSLRHPPNFKDLVKEIAPGIQSTTPSLDSEVVTDDILPANNGYHYGSSDGGTNIYGYYPDEDQESDRTVEHHGVQSETLSDETMDGVQESPSHSIELEVGSEGSSEILVSQANDDQYSRYGERTQGAETRQVSTITPFNGGGIRRPISKEVIEDMDLEMKGSEIRPVFASVTNQSKNLFSEKASQDSFGLRISNVSTEMVDNSAERDPSPEEPSNISSGFEPGSFEMEDVNDEREIPSNQQKGVPEESMGSYEEIEVTGSQEVDHGKWSEPDKFNPQSSVEVNQHNPPPTGSEELKVNPNSGDSNEVLERRPVVQLDEGLYPDSADTSGGSSGVHSTESKVVHQVYPEGYSSTTERPSDEFAIPDPKKSDNPKNSSGSGFVPPTPVSFHDNKYTFSAPSSESIFQSKDGWRPLIANNENSADGSHELEPWQRRQPLISQQTSGPPVVSQAIRPTHPLPNSNQSFEEEEEEEEEGEIKHDKELNKYTWGDREHHSEEQKVPVVPAKVKFPENPSVQENYHSYEQQQTQSHPQQQAQPHPQQQVQPHTPQQQVQSHSQEQQVQPPPQIHSHPQPQHNLPSYPQQQQPVQPRPQQLQPPTQQQRHQFHYQNNHNIDRSKYMMRPALPPIVMRRPPIHGIPHGPNRIGSRPQLIPQVQQQNQFVNNAHPTEFPHPVNRRIFKNLGPRPRGNINWPTDETRKVDIAERRTG